MSGLPQAHPGGQWPAWHVNTWDSGYLDSLDYQWDEIAVPFWTEIDALARENGVKVAIEMHPQNLVFNPPTMKRLVDKTGATHVGAEMDPSHLFWQGIDPVAAIEWLGPLVFHAAAKDTRINDNCKIYGVLDERFTRIPLGPEPDRTRRPACGEQVAGGLGVGLRRRRPRPRHRVLGALPERPGGRRPRHVGQHRTRRRGARASSRACRSPPKRSRPPTQPASADAKERTKMNAPRTRARCAITVAADRPVASRPDRPDGMFEHRRQAARHRARDGCRARPTLRASPSRWSPMARRVTPSGI